MYSRVLRSMASTGKQASVLARTKSTVTAPVANRFYLFNYFEDPGNVENFKSIWIKGSRHVQKQDHFIATYLHCSTDPKLKYPWVNFALTDSTDICFLGKKDDYWASYIQSTLKEGFKASPAAFREIGCYNEKDLCTGDKERPSTHRFFITGLKADEAIKDEDIESNWKEWSGSDLLHSDKMAGNVAVDTHLYKRFMMAPLWRYVVRSEVTGMSDREGHVIADKINARSGIPSGVETVTGFYQVVVGIKAEKPK